jgi:hypothetical protein
VDCQKAFLIIFRTRRMARIKNFEHDRFVRCISNLRLLSTDHRNRDVSLHHVAVLRSKHATDQKQVLDNADGNQRNKR